MEIILPNEGIDINTVIQQLSKQLFDNITSKSTQERWVHLPKFEAEFYSDLASIYTNMGLTGNFKLTSDPEFEEIKFYQKPKIEVDEEGAVASTVTVATDYYTDSNIHPKAFRANRPFIYILKENSTGVILQIGRISKL